MKSLLAGFLLLVCASSVSAAIVTYGTLTTDDTTNFITDTTTDRMYTRFDSFDFTFTETLAAIASGGTFDGWSIATSSIADDFYSAALGGTSTCTGNVTYAATCGTIAGWVDGGFGASYLTSSDYFAYLNDGSVRLKEIGLGRIANNGVIYDYEYWNSIPNLDTYTLDRTISINILLYKDAATTVPEAATLFLFAFGLLGIFGKARRKV